MALAGDAMKTAAALLLAIVCALAPAAAQSGSGAVARLEREFEDRFMFVTDGSGAFTVFQKLYPPLAPAGEIVCQMNECLIALGEISAARLESLASDYDALRSLILAFKAAADAQRAAQLAPSSGRPAAMAAWAQARLNVRNCISTMVCPTGGTLLQR